MMKMTLKIDGLDGLRSRLGRGAHTLDAELRPGIRASGDAVRAEAKRLAVGNRLPNSVQMRTIDGGLTAIVASAAKTALSIEKGRRPGETPPVDLITAWMGRRGIAARVEGARVSVKTGRVLGVSKSARGQMIGRAQRDLAWKIAMAIRERGTRALPFIIPAGQHKKDEVGRIINAALHRAVTRIAHG